MIRHFVGLGCVLAIACGRVERPAERPVEEASTPSHVPVAIDSGGIRIVTHTVARDSIPVFARVDAQASVEWTVPPFEGGRAPAGSVSFAAESGDLLLVTDPSARRVRRFARDGTEMSAVDGSGEGAASFRSIGAVGKLEPDSLWVWDSRGGRVAILSGSGLERGFPLPGPETFRDVVTAHPTRAGRVLLTRQSTFADVPDWHVVRPEITLTALDRNGAVLGEVGTFPGRELIAAGMVTGPRPLGRNTVFAAADSIVFVGTGERFEVRMFDWNGTPRMIVRVPSLDGTVPQEAWAALHQRTLEEFGDGAQAVENIDAWFALGSPETSPAYSRFLVAADGDLWIAEHVERDPPRVWYVLDSRGGLRGKVEVPNAFIVSEVGADQLLGYTQVASGAVTVRRYPLTR